MLRVLTTSAVNCIDRKRALCLLILFAVSLLWVEVDGTGTSEKYCEEGLDETDTEFCINKAAISPKMAVRQRAIGAVVGALVADAAATPLHWIYDVKKIDEILSSLEFPEFAPPGNSPFYKVDTGRNSAVGDQSIALLQSLVNCKGLDLEDYAKRLQATFGADSEYEVSHEQKPVTGPWRPGNINKFLENYAAGVSPAGHTGYANGDAHGKVTPLVALMAGQPELMDAVERMTRVTHNDDTSVASAKAVAQVLEQYILNGEAANPPTRILQELTAPSVSESIESVVQAQGTPHRDAVAAFGSNCGCPQSFKSALHAIVAADQSTFTSVRDTLTAGGDNTPRANVVGAVLGAQLGVDGIPVEWREKVLRFYEILDLAEKLASQRN